MDGGGYPRKRGRDRLAKPGTSDEGYAVIVGLLRHGVAEDAGPDTGWRDPPRALTPDGRRRMERAARGIARLELGFVAVRSSPLVRCMQTAEIVAAALGVPTQSDRRLEPGLDVGALIDLLLEHPAGPLLVCGHEPDMSTVTAELVGGGWFAFKKGALAVVQLDEPRPRRGELLAHYPPATLRKLAG